MFLGIDCSGVIAELALIAPDGKEIILREDTPRQADVIFPMLEKILAGANITTADLTAIGAITGPGSFTGIRVGLALAQGLADGLGIPAYGLDAFTATRGERREARDEIIVLESKRAELYVCHNHEASMLTLDEIHQLAGTDKRVFHNLAEDVLISPLASRISSLASAAAHHAQKLLIQNTPGEILAPYYVREADAKPNAA